MFDHPRQRADRWGGSGSLTALRRLRNSRCGALTVCVPVQGLAQPLSPGPEPRRSPAGLRLPSAPGQRGGRTAPVRLDAGLGQQLRQTAPPRPASNARPADECQSTRYVPCWGFRSRWHTRTYTTLSSSCSAARSGSARVRRRGTARSVIRRSCIRPPSGCLGISARSALPFKHVYDEFVRVENLDGPARWLEGAANARRLR